MLWPALTWTSAAGCCRYCCLYAYGLPLQPASTPTACLPHQLHHIAVIIVIVHFLFKRNVYLSLVCDLYAFFLFSLVLEIIFSFPLPIEQLKDVIFSRC
jgi:hypothetical protein